MYTNINILDPNNSYSYVVEYVKNGGNIDSKEVPYSSSYNDNEVVFKSEGNVKRCVNYWREVEGEYTNEYLPKIIKTSNILLYFPRFSVDTYFHNIRYALTVNTWVNGKSVVLGTYVLNRLDAVASPKIKYFSNEEYNEYVSVRVVDPYELIYSDDWKEWRKEVCGERVDEEDNQLNNTGSQIYCSLFPIYHNGSEWIGVDSCTGGQNSINISEKDEDYLGLHIKTNVNNSLQSQERPAVICNLDFNQLYSKDLKLYMKETYGINDFKLKYGLVIGNDEDLYLSLESGELGSDVVEYKFTKDDILSQGNFTSWVGYVEGMNVVCSIDVLNEDGESVLYMLSNVLPFTPEMYRFFVKGDFVMNKRVINNINLDLVDMKVYNINTVNKIEQKIINVDNVKDSKSNIIQPIFFRSTEAQEIKIHNAVSETIAINLDVFKSKVSTFVLKVGEAEFKEIGRVSSGVLFRVVGSSLPKEPIQGTYYVLNEEGDMVTSGKYMYVK